MRWLLVQADVEHDVGEASAGGRCGGVLHDGARRPLEEEDVALAERVELDGPAAMLALVVVPRLLHEHAHVATSHGHDRAVVDLLGGGVVVDRHRVAWDEDRVEVLRPGVAVRPRHQRRAGVAAHPNEWLGPLVVEDAALARRGRVGRAVGDVLEIRLAGDLNVHARWHEAFLLHPLCDGVQKGLPEDRASIKPTEVD